MSRRTADETRQLLIDTGIKLLHERGVTAGVTHIRLQDVLKRAGLTTGAAYRLWDNQEEFHHELAAAATRWRDDVPIKRTISAIRELIARRAPLPEVIRAAAAAHIAGLDEGDGDAPAGTFLTTLALRATARHEPELQAASKARHESSVDAFTELYATLMKVYGLEVRAPFTLRHFAVAMAALGEGFALQAIEGAPHPVVTTNGDGDRDGDGDGSPTEWTLFGIGVQALVGAFMQPVRGHAVAAEAPGGK